MKYTRQPDSRWRYYRKVSKYFSKKRHTGKISLSYRKNEDNPWEKLKNEYSVGEIVNAKVVGLTNYGAFANFLPGIDGMIHISQISNKRIKEPKDVLSIGDEIKAKITGIDFENHRISLSMKEALEEKTEVDSDAKEEKVKNEIE